MKRITHFLILAAAALALALPVATASASPTPGMTCGSCGGGGGGGTYAWGSCAGYPIGTIGQDWSTGRVIQCLNYNGSPTWIPE